MADKFDRRSDLKQRSSRCRCKRLIASSGWCVEPDMLVENWPTRLTEFTGFPRSPRCLGVFFLNKDRCLKESFQMTAGRNKPRKKGWWLLPVLCLMGVLAVIGVFYLLGMIFSTNPPAANQLEATTNSVLITTTTATTNHTLGAKIPAVVLDRAEAVKIGLEQTKSAINYFFVAAGACLALIIKLLVPEQSDAQKLTPGLAIIGWGAILACCASLSFGAVGFLYFPQLASVEVFSIYHGLGIAVFLQVATLLLGALATGVFVMGLALRRVSTETSTNSKP